MQQQIDDDFFTIDTVKCNGKVYMSADDILAWFKDCQKNGMDHETIQYLIKSVVFCKNSVKKTI